MKYVIKVPPRNPDFYKQWHEVIDFDTEKEALDYVKARFNADEDGRVRLVEEQE